MNLRVPLQLLLLEPFVSYTTESKTLDFSEALKLLNDDWEKQHLENEVQE